MTQPTTALEVFSGLLAQATAAIARAYFLLPVANAADGGEPRKAYDHYRSVLASGDLAKLRGVVSSDRAQALDDPDFKKMLPLIQEMEPKSVKYVNGTVDGDKATLNVTAKNGKESSTGTVTMVKQGGKWRLSAVS